MNTVSSDITQFLFKTARLYVRRFVAEDADDFFLFNSHPNVMRYIRAVKTREESDVFLAENIELYTPAAPLGRYYVADAVTHGFIGTFSLLQLKDGSGVHIGYALLPSHWGKGYALELVQAGTLYFFNHTLDNNLFAITEPENKASERVLYKAGYSLQGVDTSEENPLNVFCKSR